MTRATVKILRPDPPTDGPVDGRRLRSKESRRRIVQAMIELVHSGELEPSAEMVADRAQVGLRSVFRHFNDMESLRREMSEVVEGELRAIADQPFKGATWRERLAELMDRRAQAFERVMPYRRAGNLQTHRSAFLRADNARLNEILRVKLRMTLPPEIVKDQALFDALDLLLCFESWIRLRQDQGLSAKRARQALERAVTGLVVPG